MENHVKFKSALFHPALPEESQVNPGCYGAELAYWLCVELAKIGVITSYPDYEDWGWYLMYITQGGDEFYLCCSNFGDSVDEWHCYLRPLGRNFFGGNKPPIEIAKALLEGLRLVLESATEIKELQWWYEK